MTGRVEGMKGSWPAFCRGVSTALAAGLCAALALGLGGCSHLEARQREAIYRPTPGVPADFTGLKAPDEAFFLPVTSPLAVRLIGGERLPPGAPQRLALWWMPLASGPGPSLLYLHGTFRNLHRNVPKIDALRQAGFAVLAVDYRGWGASTPLSPSEASILEDAGLAWAEFTRRVPDPSQRVIYGHSMGGGVAVALAAGLRHPQDYAALVLESTFTSLPDVAASAGLLGRIGAALTTENMNSLERIGSVQGPLLMLHGTADGTVPFALGRRLFEAARMPDKTWVPVEGGQHSTLQSDAPVLYQQTLGGLAARLRR